MPRPIRDHVVSGAFWIGNGQILRILVTLGTIAILARLIPPEDFGTISAVIMVALIANMIGDFGLCTAAIRRPETNDRLLSCIFWTNIGLSSACALLVILSAEWIAAVFENPGLVEPLQVSALIMPLTSIRSAHRAILERALAFRKIAMAELFGTVFGSAIGIVAALAGAEIWALVAQQLALAGGASFGFFVATRWRPQLVLAFRDFRDVFGFGGRLTMHTLLAESARQAHRPIIARGLGTDALGFYTVASQIVTYPVRNLATMIQRVMFPVFARIQDDDAEIRPLHVGVVHTIAVLMLPLMALIALFSDELSLVLLGPGWEPVGPLLALLAGIGAVTALAQPGLTLFLVKNRTDLQLRVTIVSSTAIVLAQLGGSLLSLEWVAAGHLLVGAFLFLPLVWGTSFGLIDQSYRAVLGSLVPVVASCGAMAGVVFGLREVIDLNALAALLLFGPAAVIAFVVCELLLDRRRLMGMKQILAEKLGARRKAVIAVSEPQTGASQTSMKSE